MKVKNSTELLIFTNQQMENDMKEDDDKDPIELEYEDSLEELERFKAQMWVLLQKLN